ncbi:ATP-binding protein [Alkalicoccus daliensis]|uniref:histidine kinase n=1 Tax=Alkalicoccus daliensis TaxID=745820 RepID=A0A1H0EBD7_9BACI|nr:sensor histidine kinase [Alkalicoccus daliensis]SDN79671.1 two-component system, CitB family, sensor histidine kinase CitS [Alkalicoccus daliensis]
MNLDAQGPKRNKNKFLFFRLSLLKKITLLVVMLVTLLILSLGFYFNQQYSNQVWDHTGQQALSAALSVASIPALRDAFEDENPAETIQPLADGIRKEIGAEFIVVGNRDEIRYSHPLPDRLGKPMVGEDNDRALIHGESYVSTAVGSLGPSIRGKTPVFSENGEIIGVVSVGFLEEDVELSVAEFLSDTWVITASILGIGVIGAFLISVHVKRSIHGLEPEEIGHLFDTNQAVLQSIHEGMIAIDKDGNITMINQTARSYLTSEKEEDYQYTGKLLLDVLPQSGLLEVIKTGKPDFNSELWIGDELYIVNRVPIFSNGDINGAVSTFRNRTEIRELSKELSKVQQYTEGLRAQTHEFSNKLSTISGLLQLDKVEEVVEFIDQETKNQQDWVRFLVENVSDTMVSGVLLGKLNRASELGVYMSIDKFSQLTVELNKRQQENIVTILGNIIENGVEAASLHQSGIPSVSISFTDIGREIVFEVEDNGPGIDEKIMQKVFERGYSTKSSSKHRGVGLALVMEAVQNLNGDIFIEETSSKGTRFVIILPKDESE